MKPRSLNSARPPRRPALVVLGGVCLLAAMATLIAGLIGGYHTQMIWIAAVLWVAFIVLVQKGR